MENYEILKSKICRVNPGDEEECIYADVSIVCKDGLFGLVHTTKLEGSNCGSRDEELLLPLKYDNLFFIDVDEIHYVVTVQRGKQGLCSLQCRGETILAEQLLPSIYDSIHFGEKSGVLFLHKMGIISCFNIYKNCVFAKCESYKEPYYDYLLCTKENQHALWYTPSPNLVYSPLTNNISFLGSYKQDSWWTGSVFLLKYKKQDEPESSQLLFCEDFGEGFHLSPIATRISANAMTNGERYRLTQIDMSFGNGSDILTKEIVNDITKETQDF